MRSPNSAVVTLVAVALLVSLTACEGDKVPQAAGSSVGPAVRLGGAQGSLCMPASASGNYTYALDAIENTSTAAVTIERVTLVGAKDVDLVESYVAPIVNNTLIGVQPNWPPTDPAPQAFRDRAELPSDLPAMQMRNLVIHLRAGEPSEIKAVEVTYQQGGARKKVRNSTALTIKATC